MFKDPNNKGSARCKMTRQPTNVSEPVYSSYFAIYSPFYIFDNGVVHGRARACQITLEEKLIHLNCQQFKFKYLLDVQPLLTRPLQITRIIVLLSFEYFTIVFVYSKTSYRQYAAGQLNS